MNTFDGFDALRQANPRAAMGFAASVDATTEAVRARIREEAAVAPRAAAHPHPRRRARISVAAATIATAVAVIGVVVARSGGPAVAEAAAAVRHAAAVTASSADRSGTAVVRITHDERLWAGTTVRWNGDDVAVSSDTPGRDGRAGSELRVVDGALYALDPTAGGWLRMGSPASIDADSGTTPSEYLAAVREDVGGATLRRITRGLAAPTTRRLPDGATVYGGKVPAGLVARETAFKDGQTLRVLPFGFVAHDEAADPAAPLDTAVTVGADGVVRAIAVSWGAAGSRWTYAVAYSDLGAAPPIAAPANARDLGRDRRAAHGR